MGDKSKAPVDTTSMYAELSKLEKTQDFDKASKLCNKILNVSPSDTTAFHCKMVCLIQLGKFEDAVRQIRDSHLATNVNLIFEEAYCLYRTNQPEEALEVIKKAGNSANSNSIKELKAQILYRLERYDDCYKLYRDILKNTTDDFESERLTNLAAVCANLSQVELLEEDEHMTYEMCYNRACQYLTKGQWSDAEETLRKAEKMCVAMLKAEDDENEEDIEKETGIIRVQLGFAIQMQQDGRDREAQSIYNSVLKTKPADIGLVAVASNNLMTLNKDQNIFDSKKRIKAATVDGLEHKLTSAHRAAIARNNALLAMYTSQVDLCCSLVKELADKFNNSQEEDDFIVAGVLSRAGRVKEAVDLLLKKGDKDLQRVLIAAQILLEKGHVSKAIQVLERLPAEVRFRTGLLSSLVALYLAVDDRTKAAKLLKEAVSSSKAKKQGQGQNNMAVVWRKTAEFHLKGDEPSVAAQSLEELFKLDPSNKTTLAQLVVAYSKFDLKKALEVSKKLPDFSHKSVDVDALEASAVMSRYGKKIGGGQKGVASPKPQTPEEQKESDDQLLQKKKRKKKRKKRLPKEYNPNVDPDPERWVPRRERTGYRKTRKERRKGEKFTGAQGMAAGQSETYDYSSKKSTVASSSGAMPKSPAVGTGAPVGPRQQKKMQPKGKKKGGKRRF